MRGIQKLENVIHLSLGNNNICEKGMSDLFNLIKSNNTLVSLDLSNLENTNKNKMN